MVYAYNLIQEEIDYLAGRMEIKEIFDDNIDFLKGQEIVKCLYMNTDYGYLKQIAEDLLDITGDVDVSYSSNRYIEFNHKGVNKGNGLKVLADHLGIDLSETIAVGDNFNDLSMIQAAGLGVGAANTVPDMKPLCDVITKADCDHSAIAEIVNTYLRKA